MVDRASFALTLGTVVLLSTSCAEENAPESDPPPPAETTVLYSNVWSGGPGVDLSNRGAELIRAAYEAGELTSYVGLSNSYPGYESAVGGPARHSNRDKEEFLTWREPEDTRQAAGTNFAHIADFATTDSSVAATVCSYEIFSEPHANITLNPLNAAFRVELERTADDPGQPGVPDTDPARQDPRANRVPTWNVFEGWKITKLHYLRRLDGDVIPQGCTDWWQQQFPAFAANASGNLVPPPGFEPPTMPVAVQYPEWIGPANSE